jgi:hypothetical protein
MSSVVSWIHQHRFEAHLTAFLLMVIPSSGLYFTSQGENEAMIWSMLGVFIIGNLLAMIVK